MATARVHGDGHAGYGQPRALAVAMWVTDNHEPLRIGISLSYTMAVLYDVWLASP